MTEQGWRGRFLEDFRVGDVYRHSHGRTISEADNTWFTLLTSNTHQIHVNADYASRTEFGRPLVVSTLTLAIVTGLSVADVSQNAVANLGWNDVRLPAPGVRRRHAVCVVGGAGGAAVARRGRDRASCGSAPDGHQPAWRDGHPVRAGDPGLRA